MFNLGATIKVLKKNISERFSAVDTVSENSESRLNQSANYNRTIILSLSIITALYTAIVLARRPNDDNVVMEIILATFLALNILTITLVTRYRKLKAAANLSVVSILMLSASAMLFARTIPVEFFIILMPLASCIFAIGNLRFALAWLLSLGACSVGFFWVRATVAGLDSYVVDPNVIIEQITRASIVGFSISLVIMQLLRMTNERSSKRALSANEELADTLEENKNLLKMVYQVQQVGRTFFFRYKVNTDEFYSTLSRPVDGSPKHYTLQASADFYFKCQGSESQLIKQIRTAMITGANWNSTIEVLDADKKTRFVNIIGEVTRDGDQISMISGMASDITELKTLNNKLYQQANFDHLTGLLNRHAFELELKHAYDSLSENSRYVYLFLDLDRFKIVNDTSGHKAGDELLKQVSRRIKEKIGRTDIVARLGGDEFAILLKDSDLGAAKQIAESIRLSFEGYRFTWEGTIHGVGVSIGVIEMNHHLGTLDDIQNLADEACYQAKNSGRNRVEIADVSSEIAKAEAVDKGWANRISQGISNNYFVLYAQEIKGVQPHSCGVKKYEILIRYADPHDNNKIVPPAFFLPAAERYNMMIDIDCWVFENLHRMLSDSSAVLGDHEFWINLSGDSMGDARVADHFIEIMKSSPLPQGTINFEITETSAIKNLENCMAMMARLREYGCRFALDDFGSGHASFGYLRNLPVDVVKVDGMFIKNILEDDINRIFTQSIIDVADAVSMEVVVEFVESTEIRDLLTSMGADYVQGFGVDKPKRLAMKELSEAIDSNHLRQA